MLRTVDPQGNISFAGMGYPVGRYDRGARVEVRLVGDTVQTSLAGRIRGGRCSPGLLFRRQDVLLGNRFRAANPVEHAKVYAEQSSPTERLPCPSIWTSTRSTAEYP